MSDTDTVAPLRVANEAFLVASMIERCLKTMMLRELIVNGLEAAEHAVAGGKRARYGARGWEYPKALHLEHRPWFDRIRTAADHRPRLLTAQGE